MNPGRISLHARLRTLKLSIPCLLAGAIVTSGWAPASGEQPLDVPGPALESPAVDPPAETSGPTPESASGDQPESVNESESAEESAAESEPSSESESEDEAKPTDEPERFDEPTSVEELKPAEKPKTVGEPLAPGMVALLQNEIMAGVQRRRIQDKFARFGSYAGVKLNATARRSGSEVTGICRLRWYDHLLRSPLQAPAEAEAFTRRLHQAVLDERQGLAEVLSIAGAKLDVRKRDPRSLPAVTSPEQALEVIKQSLTEAQLAYCAALAPLSKSEIQTLSTNLYPIFTGQNRVGHTLQARGTGRRLCELIEKLDRSAMHAAAEALVPLADPQLLEQLRLLPGEDAVSVEGATGTMVQRIDTPSGAIVIGGKEQNSYQLDKMLGVNVVIDLGGNDTYHEGTVSTQRPVLVVIDLDGDDAYRATKPGVQGSGILGVSMLVDLAGNDVYQAQDVAQGSCLVGAGILIDCQGNDAYIGVRRAQAVAIGGTAILIDRAGNDRYYAAMWTQGFGGPRGFGLLDDVDGKDHYYGGGLYVNSYIDDEDSPTPGYEGWAQGVGSGLRQVADGGIGVILDGGGDDVYEYDYLSHGGGYWCGTGFARDFGGNDRRLGATRKAYGGGQRTQRSFQRFGTGYGCHYALGFLFDDRGNDTYNGTIMCLGFAWDCSMGYLCDFGGNDSYNGTQGNGAQAGLGVIFDYDGDDVYQGRKQGYASSGISYHDLPHCGGNFGFVIDYGGTDKYGCRVRNNSYNQRGSSGGFLIDRPKQKDVQNTAKKPVRRTTVGS